MRVNRGNVWCECSAPVCLLMFHWVPCGTEACGHCMVHGMKRFVLSRLEPLSSVDVNAPCWRSATAAQLSEGGEWLLQGGVPPSVGICVDYCATAGGSQGGRACPKCCAISALRGPIAAHT